MESTWFIRRSSYYWSALCQLQQYCCGSLFFRQAAAITVIFKKIASSIEIPDSLHERTFKGDLRDRPLRVLLPSVVRN